MNTLPWPEEDEHFCTLLGALHGGKWPKIIFEFGETHVFIGLRYVVSVRHGSLQSHVGLRARCEASQRLLAKGPGFVPYLLMDFVVDQYFPILEALEEQVVELEEVLFGEKFIKETTARIYQLKRELLSVKRAVSPLVDVCSRLMRFDLDLVPEVTKPYFRDAYDHVIRINEMVDTLRELLATALEANLSIISVSQNKDTKRLAAVGRDHRRTYGDRWHLRHELPIHARAGLAIRLPSDPRRNGGGVQCAMGGFQAVGMVVTGGFRHRWAMGTPVQSA